MEYERIILELMERIGQLEDRVEKLETAQESRLYRRRRMRCSAGKSTAL